MKFFVCVALFLATVSFNPNKLKASCDGPFRNSKYDALAKQGMDRFWSYFETVKGTKLRTTFKEVFEPKTFLADPIYREKMTLPYELALLGALGEIPLPDVGLTNWDLVTYVQSLNFNSSKLPDHPLIKELIYEKFAANDAFTRSTAIGCLVGVNDLTPYQSLIERALSDSSPTVREIAGQLYRR